MTSPDRQQSIFALVSLFILGWWTRAVPLWWSPLPATLDGFVYARVARSTLVTGHVPLTGFRADAFGSTLLSATVASVTGTRPLLLLQPLYAFLGALTVLLGFVFLRRLGRHRDWGQGVTRRGAILTGVVLAAEGIFVRRTGIPDDDTLTLFLIPLVAVVGAQYLKSRRRAWLGVLVPFLIVFPLVHTFSTFVLGLTLLAGGVLWMFNDHRGANQQELTSADTQQSSLVSSLQGVGLVGGFWLYFLGYYTFAARTALNVPYVDRVSGNPGLFVAWALVLVIGVVWFQQLSVRGRRIVVATPIFIAFTVFAVNTQVTVFPETAQTPQAVLLGVAPLAVLAGSGAWGSSLLGDPDTGSSALLALFAAPVVIVLFSLTAALTPEFFATALRAQTHLHLSIAVVGGAVIARGLRSGRGQPGSQPESDEREQVRSILGVLAVFVFIAALVATTPVAYVNLDTGSVPSTSLESEFAAGTFVTQYLAGSWTSSHTQVRIAGNYYPAANGTVGPTRTWLRGGPPPTQPVLTQRSWTTTGAHLFPLAPATVSAQRLSQFHDQNNVVYVTSGRDPVRVVQRRSR